MSSELPTNTGDLIDSALNLPVPERVELANAILASFEQAEDEPGQAELDKLWSDEITRRVEEVEAGRVRTIPSSEMWKRIGGKPNA
jgi:putative addiction module component (TIGR02574 family)